MLNLMISAGEASGDAHAAHALQALKRTGTSFTAFGMGASELEAVGTELIVDARDLSVIGFVDALRNYHKFMRRLKLLRTSMHERKPDLLILVDFPDFNLKLAETARALNIPVLFYVSPQIWAWRGKRIHRIGRLVNHMAVLFPFEVPLYEKENIPVTYVGNPVVEDAVCDLTVTEARKALGLDATKTTIGLLPGSRPGELMRILPVMLDSASRVLAEKPGIQFVLPRAKSLPLAEIYALISEHSSTVSPIVTDGRSIDVMRASDIVLCASGTATLETALIGTPLILVYKISALNYAIMSRLIKIDHVGLVNIVAGKEVVPELLQHEATPEKLASVTLNLLGDEKKLLVMRQELERVKKLMGAPGASGRVAELIRHLTSS